MFIIHRARRLCRFIEQRRDLPANSVRLPVVINISYGVNAGPRDGSSLFERFMDAVSQMQVADLGPVRFVLPIGNQRQERLAGRLRPGQPVCWRVQPDDQTPSALEIWGPRQRQKPTLPFAIRLAAPGCSPVPTNFTTEGEITVLRGPDSAEIARAYYLINATGDGRWREGIVLFIQATCPLELGDPYAPPGDWSVEVDRTSRRGIYEISVQRDEPIRGFHREARQSYLHDPDYYRFSDNGRVVVKDPVPNTAMIRRSGTPSAYCGGREVVRLGAAMLAGGSPSPYSSLLRNGKSGDVLAISDRSVPMFGIAVHGRNSGSRRVSAGTSVAAPQATRWLAGILANGERPANRADIVQRAQLLRPASATPVTVPFAQNYPAF